MTINPLQLLEMTAQRRVDTARSALRSNIEWTIRHLQEELANLDSRDDTGMISWSAMNDLPKDAAQFSRAKEALAEIKVVRKETEQQ